MKDANQMTPEELRALADQREFDIVDKVIKTGELKHDLYYFDFKDVSSLAQDMEFWATKEELDIFIKDVMSLAPSLNLKKGDSFSCYHYSYEDMWFDDDGVGMEEMPNEWAEKHLINIKDVK